MSVTVLYFPGCPVSVPDALISPTLSSEVSSILDCGNCVGFQLSSHFCLIPTLERDKPSRESQYVKVFIVYGPFLSHDPAF